MANHEIPVMYKVEPLYDPDHHIPLPSCMYKMRSIFDDTTEQNCVEVQEDSSLQEIEHHQLLVLEKLENLKKDVLRFKNKRNVVKSGNDTFTVVHVRVHLLKQCVFNVKVPASYQDIVIKASPDYPPLSLWVFYNIVAGQAPVQLATFTHSSLINFPDVIHQLHHDKDDLEKYTMTFTVIWKKMGKDAEMMIDPVNQGIIAGEINIARYISRLLSLGYDTDAFVAAEIDYWLQLVHSALIHGSNKEKNTVLKSLNSHLGKKSFLVGNGISVADIILWSAIIQCNLQNSLPNNIGIWWNSVNSMYIFKTPLKL